MGNKKKKQENILKLLDVLRETHSILQNKDNLTDNELKENLIEQAKKSKHWEIDNVLSISIVLEKMLKIIELIKEKPFTEEQKDIQNITQQILIKAIQTFTDTLNQQNNTTEINNILKQIKDISDSLDDTKIFKKFKTELNMF